MTMHHLNRQHILVSLLMIPLVACASTPTQTATSAVTLTAKPTFTSTPTPTNTPSPISTPEAKIYEHDKSTSPDGKWSTSTLSVLNEDDGRMTFTIINNADNREQIIEDIEIPGPIRFPVIFDYPYVFQWSKDGRSFYFSYLSSFIDGCFAVSEPGGTGLKKYDLSSGSVITIHKDHAEWMALSPNESQLAYIGAYSGIVFIIDMESNNSQPFAPPAIDNSELLYYADFIYWSPDGKSLVYSYFADPCNPEIYPPDRYLVQLFPNLNQLKILLSPNEHDYIPIEWNIQERIILKDNDDNLWWLNPITKEITPAQP